MQGIVITGNRTVTLQDFPDPSPGPGEVIVAIKASGICGTDIHRYRAPPEAGPAIIAGHEPAGIIVAIGSGVSLHMARKDMRVMVHHYEGCTACNPCRTGWTQMCTSGAMKLHGRTAHGSHAPFMSVPAYAVIPLDDRLTFEDGAAIGCATGTAWGAIQRLQLTGRETVAIFGQGPVGASATALAAASGNRVIAIDIDPGRLALAAQLGAWQTLDGRDPGLVARILDLADGIGVDSVIETSGNQHAADQTLECIRPWGRACYVGVGVSVTFDVHASLRKQLTIMTSWTMSVTGQRDCAAFVAERGINLTPMFGSRWKLVDATGAFETADKQIDGKTFFGFG